MKQELKNMKMWALIPVLVFITLLMHETLSRATTNSGFSADKRFSPGSEERTPSRQLQPVSCFNGYPCPSSHAVTLVPLGPGKIIATGWIFY